MLKNCSEEVYMKRENLKIYSKKYDPDESKALFVDKVYSHFFDINDPNNC
jgi:hypothetical protein